ncbi:hypothetical protein R3W88_024294 [Solanum pinnatisectum]|uniref:Uncharacterized protein n=1 Tax=Solanum pinnatisectum TaxID=50273 RepID=A0AAV9M001_9SOLN|nr:hypothetical protein R3W88_024294 [Solanum pinnatisectum]
MAHKDKNESDNDEVQNQMASQETVSTEEVRVLRQQMEEMYEAWMSGQAPLFSILSTNVPIYPPGFDPYANTSNVVGTSTVRLLSTPMMSNPLFIPQPIMDPKSNNVPPPKVEYDQDYIPGLTFKIPGAYPHSHQYSFPVEAGKAVKNEEHEETTRKMKSLEHASFNDLCMFPHVHLPIGFKTPKFEKYDGHGDLVAHLKRYCNKLRGAGTKKNFSWLILGKV